MKHTNFLTLTAVAALSLVSPAIAGTGHDHSGHGHDHAAETSKDMHDHEGHSSGKAGDFASTNDALATLKAALAEADAATQNDTLEALHDIYPSIEGAAAYIHDYAKPVSEDMADRFHASVDQMLALVSEMHDTNHSLSKDEMARLLKKVNGAVLLIENYLPESDRTGGQVKAGDEHDNPVVKAFKDVNDTMHANMDYEYTGDADVDFIRGMIPHHQGAIDMAKVVLKYGKDPEIQKLANDVILAQEEEIRMMREWLAQHE